MKNTGTGTHMHYLLCERPDIYVNGMTRGGFDVKNKLWSSVQILDCNRNLCPYRVCSLLLYDLLDRLPPGRDRAVRCIFC